MPATPVKQMRLNDITRRRLRTMAAVTGRSEKELVELAVTNLRAALLRGAPVVMTIPDEPDDSPKGHKRPKRAA